MKIGLLPLTISLISVLLTFSSNARENDHHHHQAMPDAPVGIMGHHIHAEGQWMISYSAMLMDMQGNRDGTDRVSTPLAGYMISPLQMDMKMHMLGVMTGVSDDITLMLMVPVIENTMDLEVNMNGNQFTTEASGLGDIKLAGLFKVADNWVGKVGLSFPSGSIDEKDVTPASMGNPVQLPYPMQLGSGSYELNLGATFMDGHTQASWGMQVDGTFRLDDNDRDYKLGNAYQLSGWYSHALSEKLAGSLRLKLSNWRNIQGRDAELNPMMVPTADANLRAGTRADLLVGLNYPINSYYQVGIELGAPIYQRLDGPQLETDALWQLGLQAMF